MDFGAILDKWEKQTPGNVVYDKDAIDIALREKNNLRRSRLLRKKPEAYIDLHGLKRDEAWRNLEIFFEDSRSKGYEKIQVIHGKGSHPHNEAVLRELSRRFIETCSFAGESGYCSAREGGTGATWVILKKADYTAAN